jgi:hypothetical protein
VAVVSLFVFSAYAKLFPPYRLSDTTLPGKHFMILVVASPGIEPGSGASETLILSIVLRGHAIISRCKGITKYNSPIGYFLLYSSFMNFGNGAKNSWWFLGR